MLVELLRVDGPDDAGPVTAVRTGYQRWHSAAGGRGDRAVQPPGEAG